MHCVNSSLKLCPNFEIRMETIQILRDVSKLVYEKIKGMPGTNDAAGDFGIGAGGDISRNIDITAENTVLNYLKEINLILNKKMKL